MLLAFIITCSITGTIKQIIAGLSKGAVVVATESGQISSSSQSPAAGSSEQAASNE